MATVHLAQDLRHEREVAIKVLRPELTATLGAERFLREIKIAAKLNHPHILALHNSGEANGFLYYVMPYVEGESLRDLLNRESQLPIEDALTLTREIADALEYAHGEGVIHRDIKPENIMLSRGHAVVADFGIARAVAVSGGEQLTETGMAVGTPAYMSPEQATAEQVDVRSDVYSLGCVLYEMLAGEVPYTAPTPQAVIAKKLSEPTPRISVVREMIPAALEHATDRALSDGNREENLAALRRASELAPQSLATNNLAMFLVSRYNRPREAADLLLGHDVERQWVRQGWGYWSNLFGSLMMLDEHEQALDVASRARRQLPERVAMWLRCQADALAAMGRVEELHEVWDEVEARFTYPQRLFGEPLEVLRAYGHDEALKEAVSRVIGSFEARPASEKVSIEHRHWYGRALFLAGRIDEAQDVYDALVEETPGYLWRRAIRAFFSVSRGDTAQAQKDLAWFENQEPVEAQDPTLLRLRGYILGALGDLENAMELIRQSYEHPEGTYGWRNRIWLNVAPLRGYPRYQEFIRPKG